MVRIRLRKVGQRRQITYRTVAANQESLRDGKFLKFSAFTIPELTLLRWKQCRKIVYITDEQGCPSIRIRSKLFTSVSLMDRYARYKAGDIESWKF